MFLIRLMSFVGLLASAVSTAARQAESLSSEETAQKFRSAFAETMMAGMKSASFVPASDKQVEAVSSYSETGFVYQVYSNGNTDYTCKYKDMVGGYPVDTCIVSDSYSLKMQLVQNNCTGSVVQYFGDTKCQNFLGTSTIAGYEACTRSTNSNFPTSQMTVQCTTNPVPGISGSWASQGTYDGTTCAGSPSMYLAFSASHCIYYQGFYTLFNCTVPALIHETQWLSFNKCTGTPYQTFAIPAQCEQVTATTDDINDDDGYVPPFINPPPSVSTTPFPTSSVQPATSSMWYCPTQTPTPQPMASPTAFPTSAVAAPISFDIQQTLVGIDLATFTASASNQDAVVTTIAQSMTGTTEANIINFAVSTPSRRRLATTASVLMSYTVSVASTATSADQLYSQLSDVVASGAFNTALFTNAAALAAPAVQSCTSSSVAFPDPTASPTAAPTDPTSAPTARATVRPSANPTTVPTGTGGSNGSSLSAGAIAGIAIGIVAFAAIVAGAAYFFMIKAKAPMATQNEGSEMANKA